jgi:hypothetical protein
MPHSLVIILRLQEFQHYCLGHMPSLDFFTPVPIKYLAIKTIEDIELEKSLRRMRLITPD